MQSSSVSKVKNSNTQQNFSQFEDHHSSIRIKSLKIEGKIQESEKRFELFIKKEEVIDYLMNYRVGRACLKEEDGRQWSDEFGQKGV